MILAIDMGNTNIVLGGIDEKQTYFIVVFKGGTTEERMAPSMSDNWMWCISRMFLK